MTKVEEAAFAAPRGNHLIQLLMRWSGESSSQPSTQHGYTSA